MSVTDEDSGRYKAVAYIGLVALATAFGYSMGMKNGATGLGEQTMQAPTGLQVFGTLARAADEARDLGDEQAASRFESAASFQRTRLMAWTMRVQEDLARRSE